MKLQQYRMTLSSTGKPTNLDAHASSAGMEAARRMHCGCTEEAALDTLMAADMTESGPLP